jgi:hypothetical protein
MDGHASASRASKIVIRASGADELALQEALAREAKRIIKRTARVTNDVSEQPGPAAAPEDLAALDIVPTDMAPRKPSDFGERMKKARMAAAEKRKKADLSTTEADHRNFASHYGHLKTLMEGDREAGMGLLKKPSAGLVRAIDTLFRKSLTAGKVPKTHQKRALGFVVADMKTKKKKMKGKGFGDFLRKAGKFVWGGVKLASKVAVPIVGAVAPELLPAAMGIAGAIGAADTAFKKKDVGSALGAAASVAQAAPKVADAFSKVVKGASMAI